MNLKETDSDALSKLVFSYRFLPDVALADIAFEAKAGTLEELFEACAKALTAVMVDRRSISSKVEKVVKFSAEDIDRLLYDFLTELIVIKDVESLLFREFHVSIEDKHSACIMKGEHIDRERHRLRNDVKAVTMHMFGIRKITDGWQATVVLDI
jgi:SHS2 domain-containing protein